MTDAIVGANGAQGRIVCDRLRKVYYDRSSKSEIVALGRFDLDIRAGEFTTIVGPSGCGKTTFLNIVAGFEKQSAGQILVDDRPITGPGPDRGVVFQDYALFPWLRVVQNVAFGLIECGASRSEGKHRAIEWLERVGLEDFGKRYPHELSGGMRQRVALIRVLANNPRILLMDEPFAALDALTRSVLQTEVERIWQVHQKTVVFVTHNVEEALFLGDRVVIMSGRPSSIKRILEVDLPRPRDVTSDTFNEYRRVVMKELEGEQNVVMTEKGEEQ